MQQVWARTAWLAWALSSGAVGLRMQEEQHPSKQQQVIFNFADVQYYCHITVGGQRITGIVDTGSFDLVVFDRSCTGCSSAAAYNSADSPSFTPGPVMQDLNFGSGTVDTVEGFDRVALGPFDEANITLWLGLSASMPVLENAAFQSIIGLGPPETSAADAWDLVDGLVTSATDTLALAKDFPSAESYAEVKDVAMLATELAIRPSLMGTNKVARFSLCLGRKPGSHGILVWNDTTHLEMPEAFQPIKVMGRHSWTLNMTDVRLEGRTSSQLGCGEGCGVIIDSGTSFIMMPTDAANALKSALGDIDCSDLYGLPALAFRLGDQEFSLPPDAYVVETSQAPNSLLHFTHRTLGSGCELAIVDTTASTQWGPLWVLGMPFLRSYYTTFQFGNTWDDRYIYASRVADDCNPAGPAASLGKEPVSVPLRSINSSRVFTTRVAHGAMTQDYLVA